MGHADEERDLSASRPRRREGSSSRGLPFGRTLQRLRYSDPEDPGRLCRERRHRVSTGNKCQLRRIQMFRERMGKRCIRYDICMFAVCERSKSIESISNNISNLIHIASCLQRLINNLDRSE